MILRQWAHISRRLLEHAAVLLPPCKLSRLSSNALVASNGRPLTLCGNLVFDAVALQRLIESHRHGDVEVTTNVQRLVPAFDAMHGLQNLRACSATHHSS